MFYLYISICVSLHEIPVPGDAALWTAWDCSALLDWDWPPVWDFTPLFLTGLPPLHSPEGARLAPHSIPWLRITVVSWGTSGVVGTSAAPCCCLLAALMLHTLQPEPPRSKSTCTTDYSENCGAATAPSLQLQHQTS